MKKIKTAITLITMIMTVMVMSIPAEAGDLSKMSAVEYQKISDGGLLYDNWAKISGIKTEGTHLAYPAEGQKKGASTWRCKECHGWDYSGRDGAYSGGSHYTGIKGIRDYAGKDPADVVKVLNDKTHSLGKTVSADAIEALAYFVSYGQIDMKLYINRDTDKAAGNLVNGAKIYANTCGKCHGTDGKKINFKTEEKPQYLGTLANKNPWETMHKMRYGQPGTDMISLMFLSEKEQVDVLAYCQSLPVK